MRRDVLALTEDDLIALSNRGTVKKASREQNKITITFTESEALSASLSSGETVTFPAKGGMQKAGCSCAKAFGWCVHRVLAVLAYQAQMADQPTDDPVVWNPATITDDQLKAVYPTVTLNKLKRRMNEGHLFALSTGLQPTARLLTQGCTVRFMVAHDVSNGRCDCAESFPCSHIAQAVWAFRQLEGEHGLLETRARPLPIPTTLIADIRRNLTDLAELGIGGMARATNGRLTRLASRCQQQDLVWPATLIDEILAQHTLYHNQSARFSEVMLSRLVGELLIRLTATETPSPHVPTSFVRGTRQETGTRISTTRLQGLGAEVHSSQLTLYFQVVDTGERIAIRQPLEEVDKPFWQIAQQTTTQNEPWSRLSGGQLLVSGKKGADNVLALQKVAVSPPDWSLLRSPVMVADYAELVTQLQLLPPRCLRPRRVGDDLFVLPVAQVGKVGFDGVNQQVVAMVQDEAGQTAVIQHPYTTRGREGVERLLAHLKYPLHWVAGQVRLQNGRLLVRPISFLFNVDGQAVLVQPDIDRGDTSKESQTAQVTPLEAPIPAFLAEVQQACGALLVVGLRRVDEVLVRQWGRLAERASEMGFVRLAEALQQLATHLAQRRDVVKWEWQTAVAHLFYLLPIVCIAEEL